MALRQTILECHEPHCRLVQLTLLELLLQHVHPSVTVTVSACLYTAIVQRALEHKSRADQSAPLRVRQLDASGRLRSGVILVDERCSSSTSARRRRRGSATGLDGSRRGRVGARGGVGIVVGMVVSAVGRHRRGLGRGRGHSLSARWWHIGRAIGELDHVLHRVAQRTR